MTKLKKVVAIMLALLMMFSSASVLATAWDATTDDGSALTIATKFFKEVDGEWVETTKVRPNDTVKARVYLGTDYYSNDSTLLFFYDSDFFTLSSTGALAVNSSSFVTANGITANYKTNSNVNSQVAAGYIDSAFLGEYSAVTANVYTEAGDNDGNVMYDNSDWLLEFTMTVKADASGEGDFFVKDTTVQNTTTQSKGIVNVPKGPADGTHMDIWAMWLWDANVSLSSQPVTTISSVTFNANGGKYDDGTDSKLVEGEIDSAIAEADVPTPSLEGYTFMGWVDATDADPTLDEAAPAPTNIPENDLVLNAFWLKNVNITFNTDGGSKIAPIENVTPYTDFADVTNPTKAGYTFVGWDVRGEDLPETYPDVDTTYTAIWALNVVVSFNTLGGTEIADVPGYEGDEFKATIPNPTKEGHRFVKWDNPLPTVFPEADTTYTAVYETLTYILTYVIDGEYSYEIELEYGAEIPTSLILAELPDGTEIKQWYTDAACSNALADGATMGAANATIYAKTENKTYDAIFMVDGEEYKVVPTVFGDFIAAPADPAKLGYNFAGWDNQVGTMPSRDIVFNATWVESDVNVVYYLDGTGAKWETFTIAYGDVLDVPADPYKEGYEFKGWAETADGEVVELPATMPAEELEYYAIFEVLQYTASFDSDGGTPVDEIKQDYNTTVTLPAAPTKTGYTFLGWMREDGSVLAAGATYSMPAVDETLTAQWKINQYTITFANTGDKAIDPITQDYGTAVTAPAEPSREGYTWNGWDKGIPATMPAENITINGQWTINQYTITFDTDGGSDVAPITQNYGTAVTAPADPTKTGYTFAGWDGEVPATMPAKDVTLTAQWTINQYTITFDTAGGSDVAPIKQDYGTAVTAPAAPTKTGYSFAGWDKEIPATMPAEDVTITAKWTVNQYTITFNTDGGSEVAPIKQDYGTTVTAPAAPTKTGYTFAGWDKEVPATMPAENVTITAKWTINSYNATFDAAGGVFADGKGTATTSSDYGTAIKLPDEPTKTGYTFAGWTPAIPEAMPENGIALTATWEAITYKATFDADGGKFADGSTENKVLDAVYDADFTAPAAPTKTGYDFSHWEPEVPTKWNIAGDETFKAVWVASDATKYTVYTHTMNANGGYDVTSKMETGTTGETVNVKPATVAEGFKLNDEKSTYEGTIAADSSLELHIYIDRIPYTFKTVVDGDETSVTYLYGQAVKAPEQPSKAGYTFAGWDGEVPATMPANDVTLTAKWNAATDTAVTVNVNYTDVKENTDVQLVISGVYTATTEQFVEIVTEMPADPVEGTTYILVSTVLEDAEIYAGGDPDVLKHYEFDADAANVLKETVAANGSTTLSINLKAVKYTAVFLNHDGTTFDTVEMEYYSLISENLPAGEPVKEGHSFTGWQGITETTHITGNRTGATAIQPLFEANTYYVTFDANGGAWGEETTKKNPVTFGEAITAEAAPSRTGYTWAGWSEIPATMPAEDITITGNWTINQYTITFDTAGGSEVTPIKQDYNTAVTAPADPTKTGYTFAGWDKEIPATMPAEDVTITAKWTVNQYTITFNTDGGSAVAPITQDYGTAVTAPAAPTKTGYTFAGWDKEVPATMPAENVTITAKWTINSYDATFDAAGGVFADGKGTATTSSDYGTAIKLPDEPTKTGYTFAGWTPAIPEAMPENGIALTATWEAITYKATFDADGGKFADGSTENKVLDAVYDADFTAPAGLTKTGYDFSHWEPEVPAKWNIAGDETFKAVWVASDATKYTVYTHTMNANGGYDVTSKMETGTTGETVNVKPATVAEGFKLNDELSTYEGTIAADSSLELHIYIDRISYTFKTVVDNAETTETYRYGQTVVAPTAPSKTGYTFAGWDGEVPATMPAKDVTLTAQWTINQYTITFDTDGGSDVAPITQNYGTAVTAPAAPTKTGYSFAGWDGEVPATMPAKDVTLTAQWTVNQYTITFNTDGGSDVAPITQNYGTTVTAPAAPTKTGYSFAGWDGEVPATMPAKDVTLTAQWTINQYTITFNTDGGSDVAPIKQDYGTAVTAPAAPTKTGYSFAGWDGEVPATMPAKDVTLTAQWTINQYTITFNTGAGSAVTPITQDYNTDVTAPAAPTRTGYTFNGWYENGVKTDVPAKMPAKNMTLDAQWKINQYTVTFDADGGVVVNPNDYTEGESFDVKANYNTEIIAPEDPTKTGYTFAGWDKEIPEKIPAEDMTITALWTINQYTITFANTGDKTIDPITQDYGTAVTAPAEPSREGYTWNGWDKEIPATMPAEDVTITGKWTVNQYTITFDTAGGSDVAPITQNYNTAVTAPAAPTKTGYSFAGWDKEVPATMPAGNVTITAKWTVNQYTITFDTAGGSAVAPITQDYGTTVTAPAAPTKTGYNFAGWDKEIPETMPAEDVTITAKWTINSYNATFDAAGGVFADGKGTATTSSDYGTAIKLPDEPTKTGYTFAGWTPAIPEAMPENGIALTATWEAITYKATFDADGGKFADGSTENKVLDAVYDADFTAPAAPTKTGYDFSHWEPEVPTKWNIAGDETFKAVWVASDATKYTVYTHTMNANGGYDVTSKMETGTTGETVNVKPATVAEGFKLNDELSTYEGTIAADSSLELHIYIDRIPYTLSTTVEGKTETATYLFGATVAAVADPAKTGYTFDGWYTAEGDKVTIPATMPANDIIVTAKFTINQYTITFANTGDKAIDPITQDYGTAVTAPATPSKVGYTWGGWDTEIPATMPAENITITGKWTINQYTITFDTDGGSDVAPITQNYGTAVTAPAAPTKAGYTFAGWDKEVPATMPAENVTIKALWTALDGIGYTVEIYKMNTEGSFDGVVPETLDKTGKAGETVSYAPEKLAGFTYNAGMSTVEGVVAGDGSLVLKVYYDRNKVSVTINGEKEEYFYGEQITEPERETPPEGHEQPTTDGWKNEETDEPINFPITVPSEDIVIVPVYNPIDYTTTWIVEGEEFDSFDVTYGTAITAPEAPAKEGYRFVMWTPAVPETMPASDMTFTAVYEVKTGYIVEYMVNGKLVDSFSYMYGEEFDEYVYEAPAGYDFDGWYAVENFDETTAKFEAPATVTESMTLYGKLVAKTFNATFNANGGKFADGAETVNVPTVFDELIVAPAAPTRDGYVFAGWDNEVGLMVKEGMTFNAVWVADSSLTVTYIVDGNEENPYEVFAVAYGEDLDVPADPYKEGWEFLGWAETVDGEVVELPEKMPATSLKFYAIFKQSVAELVINEYEESAHGPAATPAPALVPMADYSGMIQIGTTVTLPSAEEMAIENYIFTGWVDGEGNVFAADAEIIMPAAGLELIPTYDRVAVKLVPAVGSTTVIERTLTENGRTVVKESYNDNSVTTDIYTPESEACFDQYYIYGLRTGLRDTTMKVDDAAGTVSAYIDIQGDGYTVVTPITRGRAGTGTKVEVYDYVTGELAEIFYVVIFGDIDGNSLINVADDGELTEEISEPSWSLRTSRVYYKYKAANIDGNRTLNVADSGWLTQYVSSEATIDQKTGIASVVTA